MRAWGSSAPHLNSDVGLKKPPLLGPGENAAAGNLITSGCRDGQEPRDQVRLTRKAFPLVAPIALGGEDPPSTIFIAIRSTMARGPMAVADRAPACPGQQK
jgi:hypothetical protein